VNHGFTVGLGCENLMQLDIILPIVIFTIATASVILYQRFEKVIASLFEEKKFTTRDAVLMVVSMGVMVTVIVFIPSQALQIIFIAAYSYMLFTFTYLALKKWFFALLPPAAFVVSYFWFWNLFVFNLFVVVFAILITVYLSSLFSWKTVGIFAALLTVMDVIQVFMTGHMGESATKMIQLKLPVLIMLPTYPAGMLIGLGLGDIFLAGLLAVQTAVKYDRKAGILVAGWISIAMLIFEIALFNIGFAKFFPATVVVVAGWLMGAASQRLTSFKRLPTSRKEERLKD